jgi:hypothetical protein
MAAESPSEYYLQKHLVRDLLGEMHMSRAPRDIQAPKRGHEPVKNLKIKEPPSELRSKVEDFLQPRDLTRKRVIGFSPGHIRSVLNLDTFGPNHSAKVENDRTAGALPQSPNSPHLRSSAHSTRSIHSAASPESPLSPRGSTHEGGRGTLAAIDSTNKVVSREHDPQRVATSASHTGERRASTASAFSQNAFTKKMHAAPEELAELDRELFSSTPKAKAVFYDKKLKTILKVSSSLIFILMV